MTRRIRWGVFGSGGIARRRTIPEGILPASNAELVGVCGNNRAANISVAQTFNVRAFETSEELLGANIDAVYIATPVHLHHDQVLMCAKAGKHILCEKPLGLTIAQAEEMVDGAKRAGVKLGVAFMMRFQAQHQVALRMIRAGKLGKPVYARAQLSCWYPPMEDAWRQDFRRAGGGSLVDMGVHCIDLLEMFFGPVSSVFCATKNLVHDYPPEDSAVVTLTFQNRALATVDTFFCIPDESSENVLELYGSGGSIVAKGTIGQNSAGKMLARFRRESHNYNAVQERHWEDGIEIDPVPVNTYRAEIEEFSQALIDGRKPSVNGGAGLRSQVILTACYESARIGKEVVVSA